MKRFVIITLLALVTVSAQARRYPFIKMEKSHLEGSSEYFMEFRQKLDSLVRYGSGDVRVLHVGGSHVQGGTWSNRLRTRFLSLRYGIDGGRGMVFPFAAAMTNTPVSYTTSYSGEWESFNCIKSDGEHLGLTGIVAIAKDSVSKVAVDLAHASGPVLQQNYAFNRVDLFGEGSMEPYLILQGRDTVRAVQGTEICHFDLPYYTDWFQLGFHGKGRYTVRGLYLDRSTNGFTYSEAGVNGAASASWARCEFWQNDLRRVMPDLVIFSIGINDIQGQDFDPLTFKANYRSLIQQVREVNPRCAILFSGINDSYYRRKYVNPHTPEVEKCFRELSKEFDCMFWDMYEVMGGYGSSDAWLEAGLMVSDKVHFSPSGYRLIGDLLFDAIMDWPSSGVLL